MLSRLIVDYKRYMALLLISVIAAIISTVASLLVPVLMGRAVDVIADESMIDYATLIDIIVKMAAASLTAAITLWVMNTIGNRVSYGVSADLRKRAYTSFINSKMSFIDRHSEGDILSRIIVDCDAISDGLLLGFSQLFTGIVTIIVTLVFMIMVNVYLALAVVILTPLSVYVAKFIARRCKIYFAKQAARRGEITALSSDIINMKQIINDRGSEDFFEDRFECANKSNEEVSMKAVFYSSLTNPLTRLVNAICYGSVTFAGALLTIYGGITIGGLISFLAYASKYAKPFNDITSVIAELQNSIVCLERIYELVDTPSERVADKPLDSADKVTDYGISFSHVDFAYDSDDEDGGSANVLSDITFTIPAGKKLGIVGESGCGKTTIMKLLLRYYECSKGSIRIGDVDIRDIDIDELRSDMGLMLQEPFLIRGSVIDNIRMGDKSITREEIEAAAAECFAHDFIMNLPQGYDSLVTDDNLSMGQRQLICITRLMLRDCKVVLLDEATSSIDVLNEQLIQEAFAKIMRDKTTLVVAHRLSTIMDADLILVVDGGRIVETGTHNELLDKRGVYYKLYNAQSAAAS